MKKKKKKEYKREVEKKVQKKKGNRQLLVLKGFLLVLMLALVGYLIYIVYYQRDIIRTNQKNPLLNLHEERVNRGSIYDRKDHLLAETIEEKLENGTNRFVRSYPYRDLFFHVIGVEKPRKQGVELLANPYLSQSDDGLFEYLANKLNKNISKGSSVYTTLDLELQSQADQLLGERNGAVLLMEAETGKVITYLSKPSVDANIVEKEYERILKDEKEPLFNRITQGTYTPGSIFKIVTSFALYQEGKNEAFTYDCKGVDYFNNTLVCYNEEEHGEEKINDAFKVSCNTFFAKAGTTLGVKPLLKASEALLFNQKLTTRLGVTQSKVALVKESNEQTIAETSIGQGKTEVAPLHMGMVMMALANGGLIYEPYTVDYITNSRGKVVKKYVPNVYRQILAGDEIQFLRGLMKSVVEDGTARGLRSDDKNIDIYAKTGTAEIDDDRANSWVIGFLEGMKPDLVFVIIVEDGGTSYKSAVPIGKKLLDMYYKQ